MRGVISKSGIELLASSWELLSSIVKLFDSIVYSIDERRFEPLSPRSMIGIRFVEDSPSTTANDRTSV
jgi:hypothetical protein